MGSKKFNLFVSCQAGTEAKPFPKPNTATITMYGHLRSKELPIYGTKTLAVREGTLNLYGKTSNKCFVIPTNGIIVDYW